MPRPLLDHTSDLDVHNYVSFVTHGRTRHNLNPTLMLEIPSFKTSTFQASYFNRVVNLWNFIYGVCKVAPPSSFSSVTIFLKEFSFPSLFWTLTICF